jgi:RNA polymerase sigma-70 factor (ECF subfamily)
LTDRAERTDQELVRAIQDGDLSAFEALYHRYRDWVVSLAYRFCGHREDALDVLQETFAYLLKKLPSLELRSQMKTFLYPAVKHLALARKQAARRHAPLEEGTDPAARESPPGEVEPFTMWERFSSAGKGTRRQGPFRSRTETIYCRKP